MNQSAVTVYAPASMANISVGFDILGAAVSPLDGQRLGDVITVAAADRFVLKVSGKFVSKLPPDPKQNIVYHCWQRFCQALGRELKVAITLEKNMPIGSGLGSSACSVVGALVALNEFCGKPLSRDQLLRMMGELEGQISGSVHYDNVAPCYLGGMQLIIEQAEVISQPLPIFDEWLWVLAYPGINVSTAEARAILPPDYTRQACIAHGRYTAGFVHACYSGQAALAAAMLQDVIAEPYRQQLLPGFIQARQALTDLGALSCGISGSGPTLFALCDQQLIAEQAAEWLQQHYVQNEQGFVHICQIDQHGTRPIVPAQ